QNGPMAPSTWRRSGSFRATNRWSAPAPKSNPSSTTYAVSISAAMANQSSTTGRLDRAARAGLRPGLERMGSVRDLAADQEEEQEAQDEVQAGVADQSEQRRARVHGGAPAPRGG